MFLRVDVTDGGVMAVGRVRQPIDFLEGDAVVMACRDLARYWRRCVVHCNGV